MGDVFILTTDGQATLTATVDAYNAHIQAKAAGLGWADVDVNTTLNNLRTSGGIPAFPNLAAPTAAFGTYGSLDGVHPRDAAHVLIANLMITALNAKYGTTVPLRAP